LAPDSQGLVPDLDVILRKLLRRKKKPTLDLEINSMTGIEPDVDPARLNPNPQGYLQQPPDYRSP
jgi:hypothetical protein